MDSPVFHRPSSSTRLPALLHRLTREAETGLLMEAAVCETEPYGREYGNAG
jgi:hypothetical protein